MLLRMTESSMRRKPSWLLLTKKIAAPWAFTLHLWDPPWKRVRKARGPPQGAQSTVLPPAQGSALSPARTIDPVIGDALYSVDEIPPEGEG